MTYKNRISPASISSLGPQEVYVFPSNVGGKPTLLQQKKAISEFKAEKGVYAGKTGQCFAIPVYDFEGEKLFEDNDINQFLNSLAIYAKGNEHLTFYFSEDAWSHYLEYCTSVPDIFVRFVKIKNIKLPKSAWIRLYNYYNNMYPHVCIPMSIPELEISFYQYRIANIDFGAYCYIEQNRYGAPNEIYKHKVISRFRSNAYVTVPVKELNEQIRLGMEDVVSCICCGVDETNVLKYRLSDIEI